MPEFQGFAKQADRINPLQATSREKQIIEQGNQQLQAMEVVKQTKLRNAMQWLSDRKAADDVEESNKTTNFNLKTNSLEIHQRAEEAKSQQEIQNLETLAEFSTTAFTLVDTLDKKRKQDEFDKGYIDAAMGKVPIAEQVGQLALQEDSKIQAEATNITADVLKARGSSEEVVEGAKRLGSKSYEMGALLYRSEKASRGYGTWVREQLAVGQQEIKTVDGEGKPIVIKAGDASGSRQVEDAVAQLIPRYLEARGLYGLNTAFLSPALSTMMRQGEVIATETRAAEVKDAKKTRKLTSLRTFGDAPTPENFHLQWSRLKGDLGKLGATETLLEELILGNDSNYNYRNDMDTINALLNSPSARLDQPGKTYADLHQRKIGELMQKRRQGVASQEANRQTLKRQEGQRRFEQFRENLEEQFNHDTLSNRDVELAQEALVKEGYSEYASKLANFLEYTNEAETTAQLEDQWKHRALIPGALTKQEVMRSNASPALKKKALGWIKDGEAARPYQKQAASIIKDTLRQVAGQTNALDKSVNPNIHNAIRWATERYNRDYETELAKNNGDTLAAHKYAIGEFNTLAAPAGIYDKSNPNGKSSGKFEYNSSEGFRHHQSAKQTPSTKVAFDDIVETTTKANVLTEKKIPVNVLNDYVKDTEAGNAPGMPYIVQALHKVTDVDMFKILKSQLDLNGIDSSFLDVPLQVEEQLDESLDYLINNKPTQANYDLAAHVITSGQTAYRQPGNMNDDLAITVAHLQENGNQGNTGASYGDHFHLHSKGTTPEAFAHTRTTAAEAMLKMWARGSTVRLSNLGKDYPPGSLDHTEMMEALTKEQRLHSARRINGKLGTQGAIDMVEVHPTHGTNIDFPLPLSEPTWHKGYGWNAVVQPGAN